MLTPTLRWTPQEARPMLSPLSPSYSIPLLMCFRALLTLPHSKNAHTRWHSRTSLPTCFPPVPAANCLSFCHYPPIDEAPAPSQASAFTINDLIPLLKTLQSRCDHLCSSQMSLRHEQAQLPPAAALMATAHCTVQSGTLCPAAFMETRRVWARELALLKHGEG